MFIIHAAWNSVAARRATRFVCTHGDRTITAIAIKYVRARVLNFVPHEDRRTLWWIEFMRHHYDFYETISRAMPPPRVMWSPHIYVQILDIRGANAATIDRCDGNFVAAAGRSRDTILLRAPPQLIWKCFRLDHARHVFAINQEDGVFHLINTARANAAHTLIGCGTVKIVARWVSNKKKNLTKHDFVVWNIEKVLIFCCDITIETRNNNLIASKRNSAKLWIN